MFELSVKPVTYLFWDIFFSIYVFPKTTTPTKQAAANPWNRVKTPEVEKPFSELLAAEANRSFADIMAEDVQEWEL